MRIIVDFDKCASLGQCEFEAPDVFTIGDDGKLSFVDTPPEDQRAAVETAIARCPTGAISLMDEKEG